MNKIRSSSRVLGALRHHTGVTNARFFGGRRALRRTVVTTASESLGADDANSRLPLVIAAWLIAVIAAIVFLRWAADLLVSMLLGIILAYTLAPFVNWLEARRIHRALAAILVLSVLAGGVGWIGVALSGQTQAIANQLPDMARKLRVKIRQASADDESVLRKVRDAASELDKAASESTAPKGARVTQTPAPAATPFSTTLKSWLESNIKSLARASVQGMIVLLLAYSLLAAGPLFRRKLMAIIGPNLSQRKEALRTLEEIQRQMQSYFLGLMVTNVMTGLAIGGVFFAMGVENAGFWGVAAALLHFVPYVGSLVLAAGSALATFLQTGAYLEALTVAAVALAINTAIGIGVLTWMQARLYRVSSTALLLSLLFLGWLWGPWGIVLAAPLVGVVKVVCDRVPSMERFAVFLAP